MAKITVEVDTCKGCGLCVGVCPKQVISLDGDRLNSRGYHPAMLIDEAGCIGCAMCATMCPDCAITVYR